MPEITADDRFVAMERRIARLENLVGASDVDEPDVCGQLIELRKRIDGIVLRGGLTAGRLDHLEDKAEGKNRPHVSAHNHGRAFHIGHLEVNVGADSDDLGAVINAVKELVREPKSAPVWVGPNGPEPTPPIRDAGRVAFTPGIADLRDFVESTGQVASEPATMSRSDAIALAKRHAARASGAKDAPNYLSTAANPDWMPHAWVIDAILAAARASTVKE